MPPALRQSARIARAREEEAAEVASRPAKQAKVQVKPAVRPPKPAVKEEVEVVKTEESDGSGSEGTDEEEQEEEEEDEEEEEEEASEEEASPEPDSDEYDEDGRWVGKPVELTPDVQRRLADLSTSLHRLTSSYLKTIQHRLRAWGGGSNRDMADFIIDRLYRMARKGQDFSAEERMAMDVYRSCYGGCGGRGAYDDY